MARGRNYAKWTWTAAALAVAASAALSGCRGLRGKPVADAPPPKEFVSPLPRRDQGAAFTAELLWTELRARNRGAGNLTAQLVLVAGLPAMRGRQQFDANLIYTDQGVESLRLRGSGLAGPAFDVLVAGNAVTAAVFPEKKVYRGTRADLAANPNLLGGVAPDDLLRAMRPADNLVSRYAAPTTGLADEGPDHWTIDTADAGSVIRWRVRKADLLIDRLETAPPGQPFPAAGGRGSGAGRAGGGGLFGGAGRAGRAVLAVDYSGYQLARGSGALVPTRFDMNLPNGAQLTVTVANPESGRGLPKDAFKLEPPAGFQTLPIR